MKELQTNPTPEQPTSELAQPASAQPTPEQPTSGLAQPASAQPAPGQPTSELAQPASAQPAPRHPTSGLAQSAPEPAPVQLEIDFGLPPVERPSTQTAAVESAHPTATDAAGPAATEAAEVGPAAAVPDAETLARMLAEAEERGYLRGRNEQIALKMAEPALYEQPGAAPAKASNEILILGNMRRSVWD